MDEKSGSTMTMAQFSNSLLVEIKSLSNVLKPLSKVLYENNNKLLNNLLTAKESQLFPMVSALLSHLLHVSQHKNLAQAVLAILTKVVNCIKTIKSKESHECDSIQQILHHFIGILSSIANQQKDTIDTSLRVIQTTFSLIDQVMMPYFNGSILTRMYSICFEFCKGSSMLQNISVSALFALTECLFEYGSIQESFGILDSFLEYIFTQKRVVWIKSTELKGLMWDLVSTAIKCFTANHIIKLDSRPETKENLQKMYETAANSIFLKNHANKDFYVVLTPAEMVANNNHNTIHEFIRFFKAYVTFSISLSSQAFRVVDKEYVNFRETFPKLVLVCELERNARMYIFLEAICQLLLNQYDLPLSAEKGLVFMEILARISEELCLCNESIEVSWEANQYYLDKICYEEPKITDGDFVRLIKNTIFQLRIKYEKDTDLIECKQKYLEGLSARSSVALPANMGNVKKWEHFIKFCVKIVRYLSSLNFLNKEDEEDPTRKIILELQYWFLICPVSRAKNMVLQELLVTANILTNKMQAVKVSQSVQIGSNILYGYFEDLDSIGLTIILKMMAGIKADWEEGKSFEELDEIYNFTNNVFTEETFITTDASFSLTIQALVQCSNSILADIELPKQKASSQTSGSFKRLFKMIDYLAQRMIILVKNNPSKAIGEWNFITAFLLTLCYNKNLKIKEKGIEKIGGLVKIILKAELQGQLQQKKEQDIMGLYLELCKAQIKDIEQVILEQLKMYMPRIKQQTALMDGFRILKIFSQNTKDKKNMIGSLHELQEILIKECLFRIVDLKYLKMILEGLQAKFSEKNEEYRLINLVWSIADHLKSLASKDDMSQEFLDLWEILFKNIWAIGESSSECETKQSSIHAITQVLAEAQSILPLDFLLFIVFKYFQQLVLLLLGVLPNSIVEPDKTSQTAKVSLKNYIKLFKMLIGIENKTFEQTEEIKKCLNSINRSISKFIREHVQSKITGEISLELILQILNFLKLVQEDPNFDGYEIDNDLTQMFEATEELIKMCDQSGQKKGRIDLNSHLYKKKVKPLMESIREIQNQKNGKKKLVKQDPIQEDKMAGPELVQSDN